MLSRDAADALELEKQRTKTNIIAPMKTNLLIFYCQELPMLPSKVFLGTQQASKLNKHSIPSSVKALPSLCIPTMRTSFCRKRLLFSEVISLHKETKLRFMRLLHSHGGEGGR